MPQRPRFSSTGGPARAFTLIELLIVIAIIAVLVAVSMAVGQRVLGAGKSRTTEDMIRVLDSSVVAYEQETGEMPPAMFSYMPQTANSNVIYQYAIVDGRPANTISLEAPAEQSLARYAAMCKLVPGASSVIAGINAKYIRNVTIAGYTGTTGAAPALPATGIEVLDPWGRPIRMVHPAFDGGYGGYFNGASMSSRPLLTITERRGNGAPTPNDYRRSYRPFDPAAQGGSPVGDADEGICPNRRPYFYSAGADGDPGKREDNVYSTRPTFTQETAQYK